MKIEEYFINDGKCYIVMELLEGPELMDEVYSAGEGGRYTEADVKVIMAKLLDAVAYKVTTPDGSVVISGDTRVWEEVFALAADADLLVHEACRTRAMAGNIKGTPFEQIFDYHADSVLLGEFAKRHGTKHLVLTHLIPQPRDEAQSAKFESDVRAGGYEGRVSVGNDLDTFIIGG